MAAVISLDNPVFRIFLGYAGLVIVKMSAMSIITSFNRLAWKVFINPEDASGFGKIPLVPNHPVVERIRRCHLNDLENVIPFVLLGFLYVTTEPSHWAASFHFRIFTISRFIHTFVYLFAVPQPTRALAFIVGFGINISMAYNILKQAAF